jgi:hypothetical protein
MIEEFVMLKNISLIVFAFALSLSACAPLQAVEDPDSRPTENSSEPSGKDSPLLTSSGDSQQVVIHWQRSGGFAGICQEMDVFADGHAVVTDCESNRMLGSGDLSEQDRQMLKEWLENYHQFSWKFNPPKGSADMFLDEFTFFGVGDQAAAERVQENVNLKLAEMAQSLLQQPLK